MIEGPVEAPLDFDTGHAELQSHALAGRVEEAQAAAESLPRGGSGAIVRRPSQRTSGLWPSSVRRMAVSEAALRETRYGLVYDTDGWFVLNARESRWRDYGPLGAACDFEGKRPFKQLGHQPQRAPARRADVDVPPRESAGRASSCSPGECLLIVEGEERPLRHLGLLPLPGRDGACDPRRRRRPGGAFSPSVRAADGRESCTLGRPARGRARRRGREGDDEVGRGVRRGSRRPQALALPRGLAALA